MSKVVHEGWMPRYGRRKIGRSFIHMRYFVLELGLLAYYKKKPKGNMVPLKTIVIDGNCRVEDRGLKTQHGRDHVATSDSFVNFFIENKRLEYAINRLISSLSDKKKVYILCVHNKKEKYRQMMMAAFKIQDALIWKEKIELVIDQDLMTSGNKPYTAFDYKLGISNGKSTSSSDRDSQCDLDDEVNHRALARRTTFGNGPPDSVFDWTLDLDSDLSSQNNSDQVLFRKQWRLVQCVNGLRIFEELLEADYLPRSCSRAMKAVTVVDASCEEIFELVMSMDASRFEWDCSFQYGRIVEEVDGHTAILYHRLQLNWFPTFVWHRDLCYVRYWRRNDDGSYVVLFRSREHANCGPQPGFVRAHIESGGFTISPLKSRNGRPRTKVQHLMQIDLKGWVVGYFPSFQQHCLMQILNSVAGLRDWCSQTDDRRTISKFPMMDNISSISIVSEKDQKSQFVPIMPSPSEDHVQGASRQSMYTDELSDDDDEYPESEQEAYRVKSEGVMKKTVPDEEPSDKFDISCFSGNLRCDDRENRRDCWRISDGNNFRVRSKHFTRNKTKIPAGKHIMELVAVDWFKDVKRMDHVARRPGCAVQVASEQGLFSLAINVQVPASVHYSMVFYFVTKNLVPGSLLQRFVDGDDEFRNSRLKLIPSVPKGSWIVRQSVGSTPCLLGKAVDCTYIRGKNYLEIDVDIGSSTVANGVLGLVFGVITTLVVDMAFLVQSNTYDELPEQLIGAVRVSHLELKSATVPILGTDSSSN